MKKLSPVKFLHFILIIFIIFCILLIIVFFLIFGFDYIEVKGVIKPTNYMLVCPKVNGILKKKYFSDGDYVKSGDLLIEIEDSDYNYQLSNLIIKKDSLNSKILMQKKRLLLLKEKQNLNKNRRKKDKDEFTIKYNNGLISKKEYDDFISEISIDELSEAELILELNNDFEQDTKQLLTVNESIINIKEKIDYCKIFSKIDGILIEEDDEIKEGNYYNAGKQIQMILPNNKMYAHIFIPEEKIAKIELNQKVKIYINALPHTKYKIYHGNIIELKKNTTNKSDNENSSYYIGKVEVDDPYFQIKNNNIKETKKLLFGMSLNAKIIVGKANIIKKIFNVN